MSETSPRYGRDLHKPMRVAVLFSGGASSGKVMLEDPERGKKYQVVVAGTDRPKGAREKGVRMFREADVPVIDSLERLGSTRTSSRRFFYGPLGRNYTEVDGTAPSGLRDVVKHPGYWEAWVKALEPYDVDMVALSGLMILVEEPFLSEYRHRIANVHPAPLHMLSGPRVDRLDLSGVSLEVAADIVRRNRLKRKYKGEDAVYDAVVSGEPETRSTVHFLADKPKDYDEGVIAVESKPFEIDREWVAKRLGERNFGPVRKYADELQEKMKWEGDGPAFTFLMRELADGALNYHGNSIWHRGRQLTYEGFQLE